MSSCEAFGPNGPLAAVGSSRIGVAPVSSKSSSTLYMHNTNNSSGSNKKKSASKKKNSAGKSGGSKGFAGTALQSSAAIADSFPYTGSIRPGRQSPQRVVVSNEIVLPDYAMDGRPKKGTISPLLPWVIEVKTPEEITKMRASGKLARQVLDMAGRAAKAGVTTDEIDTLVHEMIVGAGAYPSPLNYHGAWRPSFVR